MKIKRKWFCRHCGNHEFSESDICFECSRIMFDIEGKCRKVGLIKLDKLLSKIEQELKGEIK